MIKSFKSAFIINSITYLLLVFLMILNVLDKCNGNFVYSLDDAYIHLSIAKNLAFHNVWGVSNFEFSSASSSPAYTLLLSFVINLVGNNQLLPLILNVLASLLCFFELKNISRILGFTPKLYLLLGLILNIVLPFYYLTFQGMEHIFQCYFLLLFLKFSLNLLNKSNDKFDKNSILTLLFGALSVSFRYESIFFILPICIILLYQQKYVNSIIIFILSILPILIFGLFFISKGGFFLPYSILAKSNGFSLSPDKLLFYFQNMFFQFKKNPLILSLISINLYILLKDIQSKSFNNEIKNFVLLNLAIIISISLHTFLASILYQFRYEAYLVLIDTLIIFHRIIFDKLSNHLTKTILFKLLILSTFCFLGLRVYKTVNFAIFSSQNIFEQQIQMSKFINTYYQNSVIYANDIGAISFFNNFKLIDLAGLSNKEICLNISENNKRRIMYKPNLTQIENNRIKLYDSINSFNNGNGIAITYKNWYPRVLPKSWIECGTWTLENNIACGDKTVTFYACSINEKVRLLNSLKEFSKTLPISVIQEGIYLKN
ncbi:MAG: hypothetical protein NTW25_11855 [Candidatus Kapabacteria bacterium]|nr:hypothetical protein [Candidatus Kapabacteria bacterium]